MYFKGERERWICACVWKRKWRKKEKGQLRVGVRLKTKNKMTQETLSTCAIPPHKPTHTLLEPFVGVCMWLNTVIHPFYPCNARRNSQEPYSKWIPRFALSHSLVWQHWTIGVPFIAFNFRVFAAVLLLFACDHQLYTWNISQLDHEITSFHIHDGGIGFNNHDCLPKPKRTELGDPSWS